MLATVKLASEVLNEPALDRVWRDTLDDVDWESALARTDRDVVGGSIGFRLALTARREWIDTLPRGPQQSLASIALSQEVGPSPVRPPGASEKLAGLPGERVAQLLIRSRLGATITASPILAVLESTPTTGDMLGIIELSRPDSPWWPHLSGLVTHAFESRSRARGRLPQLEAVELALAMWRASHDAAWHDRAQELGGRWIADFNASGSWFPADLADDRYRLSSIRGVPAIASQLLRIGLLPAVSSPWTLDWRAWGPQ
jgi:hypothetical protein